MTKRILTSSTALMMGLTLAVPTPVLAQSADAQAPCVAPNGEPWTDVLIQRGVVGQPLGETSANEAKSGPNCLIMFGDERVLVSGKPDENGRITVSKPQMLAAAKDAGLLFGEEAQQAQAAQNEAQQSGAQQDAQPDAQAQTSPENRPATAIDDGLEALSEQLQAQGNAQQPTEPEVEQDDTAESTQVANETMEVEAANSDAATAEGDGEVETRTVTEADTRSSDEDFANAVTAQAAPDDDGLSDFGKFAVGALGAVAAGTLLANGDKVMSNSGDRVVVQREDGQYEVLKDDNALLRRPGTEVRTQRFDDGSTRETLTRENGNKIVTIKAPNGRVLRRTRVMEDGRKVVLFDDTAEAEPVKLSNLPKARDRGTELDATNTDDLRAALAAEEASAVDRRFSLRQIRQIRAVRELVPVIELEAVTFETGSAAIRQTEAEELRDLGVAMKKLITQNPYEVFLVEGHTDAVGSATSNLALSDRRAESVALALTEYFDVPPENMVVQGYGESNLKIRTLGDERENRRATVRRITPLLQASAQ